jgi:hypothetical protein
MSEPAVTLRRMLDALAKIVDEGGPLVSVAYLRFGGDANFLTAVGLRFGSIPATFRAVEDDDTLALTLGPIEPNEGETLTEAAHFSSWSACVGLGLRWAWRLTNQQGYPDGVRLEFGDPNKPHRIVVELMVAASAIRVFVATPA